MSQQLTPRQSEVLGVIQRSLDEHGIPPTMKEIADAVGFRSVNAAQEILIRMHEKGVIRLIPGKARGIRLPHRDRSTEAAALAHLQAMVEYAECNDPLNPHLVPAQRYLESVTEKEANHASNL